VQGPRLSIVVVNWNTRDLLLRLLRQLLPAEDPRADTEVVVVDNDSSDGSADAASAAFPTAVVVRSGRNGGFAFGVNRGIAHARGDWILLLNTDTEIAKGAIARFVDEAAAHGDGGVFGPCITDERGTPQPSSWPDHGVLRPLFDALGLARWLDRRTAPAAAGAVDCVSGCVFLIRRAALAAAGAMDERFFMYFEEADLCRRVRRAGFAVRFQPATAFVHHGGLSAGQAAERTFLAFRESCLLYHAAWHGRLLTEWVRACLLLGGLLRWAALALLFPLDRAGRRRLHGAAVRMLLRPALVGELCRRARIVPAVAATTELQRS
jgi:GT2 family glycosyltransferase